jgi:hypothetical protein
MLHNGPPIRPLPVLGHTPKYLYMSRAARIIFPLLMLVFLLMSLGARGYRPSELRHDFGHPGQSHSTPTSALETGNNQTLDTLDEGEHQMLHAVSTHYLLARPAAPAALEPSNPIWVPASDSPSLPRSGLESPFRPPRHLALA